MSTQQRQVVQLTLTRTWAAVLIVALTAPWLITWALLVRSTPTTTRATAAVPGSDVDAPPIDGRVSEPGPWGTLFEVPLTISPPVEYINLLDPRTTGTPWRFEGLNEEALAQYFAKVPLPEKLSREILALAQPLPAPDMGMEITPTAEIVRQLPPEARAAIYTRLLHSTANRDQRNAMRFFGSSVDDWFKGSDVSPATIDRVRPFVYRRGQWMFFADFAQVLPAISDPRERGELLKTLSRSSTLLIRLKIDAGANIDPLVEYWGRGGRENAVRPILESLAERGTGGSVNIALLLPPFARQHLYEYSPPTSDERDVPRDCHWNALNFFSQDGEDRFLTVADKARELEENYLPIYGNLALGDLVCYLDGQNKLVHTAVYIADDILFTKNGSRSSEPAMLVRMSEMKDYYPREEPLHVTYRRRKDL